MAGLILTLSGLVFAGGLVAAALSDLRAFHISNTIPLVLLAGFCVAGYAGGLSGEDWLWHLGCAGGAFVASVALFALGVWGGGDAKLVPAVMLWTGPGGGIRFLFVMAVAGGIVALVAVVARRVPLGPSGPVRRWGERLVANGHVPYGVAIAAGGFDWWSLVFLPRLIG